MGEAARHSSPGRSPCQPLRGGGDPGRLRPEASMLTPEKTFLLRFSLQAELSDDSDEDDDEYLKEWEGQLKPAVIRAVFQTLRTHPRWEAHVRNRGIASEYEVEVVVTRKPG